MLEKLGFAATMVLVASTASVLVAGILWPVTALAHLGHVAEEAALAIAGVAGIGTAVWIGWRAGRLPPETPE